MKMSCTKRRAILNIVLAAALLHFAYFFMTMTKPIPERVRLRAAEEPTSTTVVTSFWLIKGSKHQPEHYKAWARTFFSSVTTNVVLFTSKSSLTLIHDVIPLNRTNILVIIDYDEPFAIPCMKKLIKVYKSTQWAKDPEKHIHSPELYAIWNGKTCVMERVARENPFGSLYFLWVDIGSFRDTSWIPKKEWPDLERLDNIFSKSPRSVLVSSIGSLHRDITNKLTAQDGKWRSGENFLFHDRAFFVQGGAFGGRADALIEFFKYFWKTHDQFLRDGIFVGKDQLLFTHTTAFHKPRPLIMMSYRAERACGDIWFYFQQFLAADSDRKSGCKLVSMLTMDQFLVEALKT